MHTACSHSECLASLNKNIDARTRNVHEYYHSLAMRYYVHVFMGIHTIIVAWHALGGASDERIDRHTE